MRSALVISRETFEDELFRHGFTSEKVEIQVLQDEAKDMNEINPARTNDCQTMPTDDLECVSRFERVND
jgi:hypothetical protein